MVIPVVLVLHGFFAWETMIKIFIYFMFNIIIHDNEIKHEIIEEARKSKKR